LRYSYWLTLDASKCSEDQLKRQHFRPRSCEIVNAEREPAATPRNVGSGPALLHVATGSGCASGQVISSSTSALDGGLNPARSAVQLNPGEDRDGRNERRDEEDRGRFVSLSKIGDSGLGASIHSEQTSPDDATGTSAQQKHLDQGLGVSDDDYDASDVSPCQCQTQGHRESQVQGHIDADHQDDDDKTKLTRHKRE